MGSAKANEKVAIPAQKRKRSIAPVDGNDDNVWKEGKMTEAAKETTKASKKQRQEGNQVPKEIEHSSHPGVKVEADVHDASHTQ